MKFINEDMELSTVSQRKNPNDTSVTVDKQCQVDINLAPQIRKVRNTTHEIKGAIATESYKAAVSVEKARINATQVVCDKLYGHQYDLQLSLEDSDKPSCSKKPRTSGDYKQYEKVLPS